MVTALLMARGKTYGLLQLGGVLLGALAGAAGCRHADLAEQRLTLRCQRVARTVETAQKHESRRPRRLANTVQEINRGVQRHAEASRGNVDECNLRWQRESHRWLERQPVYREGARRILRGKPNRIERNAIILFF